MNPRLGSIAALVVAVMGAMVLCQVAEAYDLVPLGLTGQNAGGTNANYSRLGPPQIAPDGGIAFPASLSVGGQAIFLGDAGRVTKVVMPRFRQLPRLPLTLIRRPATYGLMKCPALFGGSMNADGRIGFTAMLSGGTAPNFPCGFWMGDSSEIRKVAVTGDAAPGSEPPLSFAGFVTGEYRPPISTDAYFAFNVGFSQKLKNGYDALTGSGGLRSVPPFKHPPSTATESGSSKQTN
jgi:hypothetical protein